MTIAPGDFNDAYAFCPKGDYATGGGAGRKGGSNTTFESAAMDSGPVNKSRFFSGTYTGTRPVAWYGSVLDESSSTATEYVFAICEKG